MASSSNNTDGLWEKAEGEEMGHGEADAPLPTDAEHVAQPVLPSDLNPADVDHYITEIATKVSLLGMDLWKQSFPTPDDDDYYHNPKDLPTFWGIAPEDFDPRVMPDIISRHRRAMILLHPDKHPNASLPLRKRLEGLCQLVNDAKDRVALYLQNYAARVGENSSQSQRDLLPGGPGTPPIFSGGMGSVHYEGVVQYVPHPSFPPDERYSVHADGAGRI
jgi:hypothetical protein